MLDDLLMFAAALLLLIVNWLAFHDLGEPHTVRDWLVLAASLLMFFEFGRSFWKRHFRKA
jgi:hypothetical protein